MFRKKGENCFLVLGIGTEQIFLSAGPVGKAIALRRPSQRNIGLSNSPYVIGAFNRRTVFEKFREGYAYNLFEEFAEIKLVYSKFAALVSGSYFSHT